MLAYKNDWNRSITSKVAVLTDLTVGGYLFCGGTLISRRHVLSSTLCQPEDTSRILEIRVQLGMNLGVYEVYKIILFSNQHRCVVIHNYTIIEPYTSTSGLFMTHFKFCSLKTNLEKFRSNFFKINVPSRFFRKNYELSCEIVFKIWVCYSMVSETNVT